MRKDYNTLSNYIYCNNCDSVFRFNELLLNIDRDRKIVEMCPICKSDNVKGVLLKDLDKEDILKRLVVSEL